MKIQYTCTLEFVIELVGGKWKMLILWRLRHGILRFNELKKQLPGISQKMLTQQLRELEGAGMITRTVYPVVPPKVEYGLTEDAQRLLPTLEEMCAWGREYTARHGIKKCQKER